MDPTRIVIESAKETITISDKKGRRIMIRRPTALDTLRLFKAAGHILAENQSWLAMASLAYAVQELDGIPIPTPATEMQIENLVDRLGDAGISAIAAALEASDDPGDLKDRVGNLLGTPS